MPTSTSSNDRPFPCEYPGCPKAFKYKGDSTRHYKDTHLKIKRFKCDFPGCTKAFSQRTSYTTHMNTHTGNKPFACLIGTCKATFADPSSCSRHQNETHRQLGAYRCPYPGCQSKIKRRSAFVQHLARHGIFLTAEAIDELQGGTVSQKQTTRRRRRPFSAAPHRRETNIVVPSVTMEAPSIVAAPVPQLPILLPELSYATPHNDSLLYESYPNLRQGLGTPAAGAIEPYSSFYPNTPRQSPFSTLAVPAYSLSPSPSASPSPPADPYFADMLAYNLEQFLQPVPENGTFASPAIAMPVGSPLPMYGVYGHHG